MEGFSMTKVLVAPQPGNAFEEYVIESFKRTDSRFDTMFGFAEQTTQSIEGLNKSVERIDKSIDCLNKSVEHIDKSVDGLSKSIVRIDKSIDCLNKSVDGLEKSIVRIDKSIDGMQSSIDGIHGLIKGINESIGDLSDSIAHVANVTVTKEEFADGLMKGLASVKQEIRYELHQVVGAAEYRIKAYIDEKVVTRNIIPMIQKEDMKVNAVVVSLVEASVFSAPEALHLKQQGHFPHLA